MNRILRLTFLLAAAIAMPADASADCVVLLHGLARTARSMKKMQAALEDRGYRTANIDYPSRKNKIEELSEAAISAALTQCRSNDGGAVHFVTHSLGGILVRCYLAHHEIRNLGRVVMLAPPNGGSEVVDVLGPLPGFKWFNGPVSTQLGTGANSVPLSLGPVNYPVGVIAGTRTIEPILSALLPKPNDGKVSVASTKVAGMTDFITLPVSHTFIMRDRETIRQTLAFIETGSFIHTARGRTDEK